MVFKSNIFGSRCHNFAPIYHTVCTLCCLLYTRSSCFPLILPTGTLRGGLPPLPVLSPDLQAEWDELGLQMGLNLEELRRIKEEKSFQTSSCCSEVFIYWLTINTQATWDEFVTVLQEDPLKWNTIASGLAQHLNSM